MGIVGGLKFNDAVDSAREAPNQVEALPYRDDAKKFSVMANVGFGIAGAMGLVGLIWGIVDLTGGSADEDGQAQLRIGVGGAVVEGTF